MLTAEEVDELFTRVNGVRNDLVALVSTTTATSELLLVENALTNIHIAIDLSAKLLAWMESQP